jgi:TM2 domain-containing membrane protein YozV
MRERRGVDKDVNMRNELAKRSKEQAIQRAADALSRIVDSSVEISSDYQPPQVQPPAQVVIMDATFESAPLPVPAQQQPQVIYVYQQAPAAPAQNVQVVNHVHYAPPAAREKWNRGVAAVLSLVFPGIGQAYKGQVFNALAWLVVAGGAYYFNPLLGIVMHVLCIVGAASGDTTK